MDYYISVFEEKKDDLIKIMIERRKNEGPGVLFLSFESKESLKVFYLPLSNESFPVEFFNFYKEKYETNPSSIIYFHIFDQIDDLNIELDLDTNSQYLNYKKKENNNEIKDEQ